jgi:hypothetical protein
MSGLKFGFNKPKPAATKPSVTHSKPAFDDSDDDNVFTKTSSRKTATGVNEDLRAYTTLSEETSLKTAKEALEQDPSGTLITFSSSQLVFDYDGVYDKLKSVDRQKQQIAEKDRLERKVCPSCMQKTKS